MLFLQRNDNFLMACNMTYTWFMISKLKAQNTEHRKVLMPIVDNAQDSMFFLIFTRLIIAKQLKLTP